MKKMVSMCLTVFGTALTAALLLSGCGASDNTASAVPTLKWYLPGDKLPDLAAVQTEANKILENSIEAHIDMQMIDAGSFTEKMSMIMASREAFDLCFTGYVNPYNDAVSKGGLMALDELLEQVPALKESIPDYFWNGVTVDGKIYGVPNQQILTSDMVPFTFKDLAEKYELDVDAVTSFKDLEPYLEKIKQNEPELFPWRTYSGSFTLGAQYEELKVGVGFDKNARPIKAEYISFTDAGMEGIKLRREWFLKGYIRPDAASVGDDTSDYRNGRYAVFQNVYKPGVEEELEGVIGRPVVAMKNVRKPYVSIGGQTKTMYGISTTATQSEKSIKFIEQMNINKELYNLIAYGIEGKHYTKLDDKYIRINKDAGYNPDASWKFGNQFNAFLTEGKAEDVWERTIEINETADKSPLTGFVLNTDSIISEISQCLTVQAEYTAVQTGAEDYNKYIDEYARRLKVAGIDRIIEEVQRQIDEFLGQ